MSTRLRIIGWIIWAMAFAIVVFATVTYDKPVPLSETTTTVVVST